MELNYFIGRRKNETILLMITRAEELLLRKRALMKLHPCRLIEKMTRQRVERWMKKVDRWVITSYPLDSEWISEILCKVRISGTPIHDFESYLVKIDPRVPATPHDIIHFLSNLNEWQKHSVKFYQFLKFILEPVLALILLTLFSPILLMTGIAIRLSEPGPIFYTQERVGYRGKKFKIFKFRTMHVNSEGGIPMWAGANVSSRLTPIGGFLRSKHLDELPQLLNIIRGELSFIGPRPERPEFVEPLIKTIPLFNLRTLIKPGITGWAQTTQGYVNSMDDSLQKLEFDLYYLILQSPLLDLMIIWKTLRVIFKGGTEALGRKRNQQIETVVKPIKVAS